MTTLRLLLAVLASAVWTPAVEGKWIKGKMTLSLFKGFIVINGDLYLVYSD